MELLKDNKELMKEWDYEKNSSIGLFPEKLLSKSNKKAWWICPLNHSWQMEVYRRTDGRKCPYCSNKRVLRGYNDLNTLFPDIAKEWDYEKNDGKCIYEYVKGSTQRVFWKCLKCGYEWITSIRDRTINKTGCPQCARKLRGQTRHKTNLQRKEYLNDAKLLADWEYQKNPFGPENYLPGSNERVWWKCSKCGYIWDSKISNRAILKRGCPCCSNKIVVEGINDLSTTNPDLAKEWHPSKNGLLKPTQVLVGSAKKIWWLCPRGHEYKASLLHRGHGTNCPICNSGRQTSFAEQAVFYYIKQVFPDAKNRVTGLLRRRMELDILIPSVKIAFEYDGVFWHKKVNFERENFKFLECKRLGLKLYRIKEGEESNIKGVADKIYYLKKGEDKRLLSSLIRTVINDLLSFFQNQSQVLTIPDIDVKKDEFKIRNYMQELKCDSLADLYPEIAEEWDYEFNKGLTPKMFKPGSSQKVGWICKKCGHQWQTDIGHRTKTNTGCPICMRQKNKSGNNYKAKRIYQYSKEWVFIREWACISDASKELGINNSNISMCAQHIRPFAGGFRWEYEKKDVEYQQLDFYDLLSSQ